ncbi:hybrid sensor histidine kinase/response regulator [Halorubrum sp. BOL3-1]|uniref:ATP-binding response regulator n=1 Tax=Halorubrum sp. BOL3-1 TaxID=2497325 RepID=UPI001004EFA7|nr:hybrid sensor histidine kinase/response regulator [Halorubrum sp. BOL3-1]QAU14156.1 hybrid sensor histidine kinase/response regulator [Halorubrum sp. BOL3-1]
MSSPLSLLHVGIDAGDQSAIMEVLTRSDVTVDPIAEPDAEAALSFLTDAEKLPDYIVSAYHLPGIDGIEFSQRRTSQGMGSAVPLVLFVKDGSESIAASALNAGVSAYVQRDYPDAVDQVVDRIRNDIDPSRSRGHTVTESEFESCQAELEWERERLEEVRRVLSHDLRSPLNVAKGYTQYISTETNKDDSQENNRNEPVSKITRALNRIDSYLDDLNVLIQQGQPVDSREPLELTEVARSAWSQSNTKKASLHVIKEGTLVSKEIVADRERTLGLFRELYVNAVDHGPANITVEVGPLPDGFYVLDDGPGIPEDSREDIFRAGMSDLKRRNGLGLARVKHIASAHGWNVSVCEGPEDGGCFEITGINTIAR